MKKVMEQELRNLLLFCYTQSLLEYLFVKLAMAEVPLVFFSMLMN